MEMGIGSGARVVGSGGTIVTETAAPESMGSDGFGWRPLTVTNPSSIKRLA
jgi:hypothetical protein